MRRKLARSFVAAFLLVVLFHSSTILACGPFTLEAIFVFTVHPAYPLDKFSRGDIGVVQPSSARSYLYVAYRYLSGSSFNPQEQKALVELWHDRIDLRWDLGESDWIKAWLATREKVKGLTPPKEIDVYRHREKPNEYETYLNCQKDAFDTAIKTLEARIASAGAENPAVRSWVEAQDMVFANCSEGKDIPPPVEQSADALSRADRTYQVAAANFYAANFDEAKRSFEEVLGDNSSPWQQAAPYLIARTLVRKASLGPVDSRVASLSEAEIRLKNIASDRKLQSSHAAANRLLDLVRLRLHPKDRLHELSHTLSTRTDSKSLKQDLWDYTVLLDQFFDNEDGERKTEIAEDITAGDDLTDWLATIQDGAERSLSHALERWHQSHSSPWLVAALMKLNGKNANATELIASAMKILPGDVTFPTAKYHAARLLMESGQSNQARTLLDRLIKDNRSEFDESGVNLLLGLRMKLAANLNEFFTYAPRLPAALSWNDDGREVPAESSELSDESKTQQGKLLFDADAAGGINRQLPLALLKEAARTSTLPPNLKRDLVQATWLRAVILGDFLSADELVPSLKSAVPEISSLLDDYASTKQLDAKRFSAIYAWLKFPGLEPVVDQGIGRTTELNQQDVYRDNWWCGATYEPGSSEENDQSAATTSVNADPPSFLSRAQVQAAQREYTQRRAIGAAPNYLCKQVVDWGTKNPADPRVPEALHLAVNSTRHGCTDKDTGRWSKTAFDLLHRQYPKSSWARKTPYWFKD